MPPAVAYVRDLLRGFGSPWFLCGGWAADTWLGRQTREHWDVDIAVLHHDQRAIFEHLPGWALVGHDPNVADDTTEPWNGRHLDLPAHIHIPQLGSSLSTSTAMTHTAYEFEFLLNERSGDELVLNRERHVTVPLDRCTRQSSWGLPTAPPEVVLFYKAGGHLTPAELEASGGGVRPRDEQDFFALLPTLTEAQRSWLQKSLATVLPEHRWLAHLAASYRMDRMASVGVVREFDPGEGWGVIDGPDVPGGCWVHFSAIAMDGFPQLTAGQRVTFRAEPADQDGFGFRAVKVWTGEVEPVNVPPVVRHPSGDAYRSTLTLTFDEPEGS